MSDSELQRETGKLLSSYFSDLEIEENIRPDWFITPEGERLELDYYIEELHVAIEVQGEQHFKYVPFFHETEDAFIQQLRRDRWKKERCKELGITLYEVCSEEELQRVVQDIVEIDGRVAQRCVKKRIRAENRFKKLISKMAHQPSTWYQIAKRQTSHIRKERNADHIVRIKQKRRNTLKGTGLDDQAIEQLEVLLDRGARLREVAMFVFAAGGKA